VNRSPDPAARLFDSWRANADSWTRVVRERCIESRLLATDAAIVEAVVDQRPRRVLDVGCGEGWLCRTLSACGIDVVGIDGSAPLIEAARAVGGGAFHVLSYQELSLHPQRTGRSRFDVVVCNFALLQEDLTPLLRALRSRLRSGGVLVIQTVHPWSARGEGAYEDGWRTEHFAGFTEEFSAPMPWYFRTLSSWVELLRRSGYGIAEIREPTHPVTGNPLSLLLIATPSGDVYTSSKMDARRARRR
jgi:2-polyprenyl-3-methyl-5-hydroxy-6-metoxy-1,4-benzoquinol methylase